MNNYEIQKALVQNFGYKNTKFAKLPTIDFVYPEYTADGNTEEFRFSQTLRRELAERSSIVRDDLKDKKIVWGFNEQILRDLDGISPRLGIADLIDGKINSIYAYRPFMVIGASDKELSSYLVKPIITGSMAWFELTPEEKVSTYNALQQRAIEKPYRSLMQKLFG